jgi:16S rRNA (cytosine967-C5)-methyltransferase
VAARVLERVERDAAFADLALEHEIARGPLAPRDVALATELVFGTLRWQRYLDWVLQPHSRRPLESLDPRPRLLLRLAAYQIVFLERVPAFAAVSDAVSLARRREARGAEAFVNGVLRSFAKRGEREREPRLPADPVDALATRCSFPTWLASRWIARYGTDDAEALMRAMNERPPLTVRTNTLRLTRATLTARLRAEARVVATPAAYAPEGLHVEHAGAPAEWRAFRDGSLSIQDEASILVGHLLGPAPGDIVADVCTAPGTKATHAAQLMGNRGRILAFDRDAPRLARVREAAARLGVTIIETEEGTAEALATRFPGACDAVLVDAPCSNLGVLRRNPEVKWRRTPADIVTSAAHQRSILDATATMLRAGGRLVYATCSLEPEENDEVLSWFVDTHRDFALDPPPGFPIPLDDHGVLRCLPHRHGTDGFTAFRLRRVAVRGRTGV